MHPGFLFWPPRSDFALPARQRPPGRSLTIRSNGWRVSQDARGPFTSRCKRVGSCMDHTSAGGIRHLDFESGLGRSTRHGGARADQAGLAEWLRLRSSKPITRVRFSRPAPVFLPGRNHHGRCVPVSRAMATSARQRSGVACDGCREEFAQNGSISGRSSALQAEETGSIPVPFARRCRGQAKAAEALRSERSRSWCEPSVPRQIRRRIDVDGCVPGCLPVESGAIPHCVAGCPNDRITPGEPS